MNKLVFPITGILLILSFSVLAQAPSPNNTRAIMQVLEMQETAWNAGDIDQFMRGYWNSDSLTFIGGSGVTYGWQTTLDNYKRRYPDRQAMGQLTFTILSVTKLGGKRAQVIGKWHLKRDIGDIGGYFTLIWRRINGKWLITSDHTSSSS